MRNTHQRTALPLAAATLLLAASCSSDSTSASDGDRNGEHAGSGPLAEFMSHSPVTSGLGGHGFRSADPPPEYSADEIRQYRRVEEMVAECMRDAGFEYVPDPVEHDDAGPEPFDEAYSLEPAEFAEQYGYGLTTIIFTWSANTPEDDDPNDDIREALGEAAREAYDDALWGEQDESGLRDSVGCHDRAYAEVVDDDEPNLDDVSREFDRLFDDVDALFERVHRDPRVSAMVGEWRECMAGHGFSGFEDLDQPFWSIHDKASGASVPEHEAPAAAGDDGGVIVEGDSRFVIAPEELKHLQEYEIGLASADFGCREEHEGDYRTVALELEEEFVDAHRDELERYRDFLHGHGGS